MAMMQLPMVRNYEGSVVSFVERERRERETYDGFNARNDGAHDCGLCVSREMICV